MDNSIEIKAIGFSVMEDEETLNTGYIVFSNPLKIKDVEDGADKLLIVRDSVEEIFELPCVINLDHKLNKNIDQLKKLNLNREVR